MCIATIQVCNMIRWNCLPLWKWKVRTIRSILNFSPIQSKLPHSVIIILATLIGTLTQIMWSLKDRWIHFVAWSREVRMLHYRILTSSNWILVVIAISKSVKMSFPWNKTLFIGDLKHKHDQCECNSVAWKISLNKAEISHTFYSDRNISKSQWWKHIQNMKERE